jgi:hypothetical protein
MFIVLNYILSEVPSRRGILNVAPTKLNGGLSLQTLNET